MKILAAIGEKHIEQITIDEAGVQKILAAYAKDTLSLDTVSVALSVGTKSHGYGHGEYDETVFQGAEISTSKPGPQHDVLKVLSTRSVMLTPDQVRHVLLSYVVRERQYPVDVSATAVIDLHCTPRHMGDLGGYEGPYFKHAVVKITY